LVKGGFPAGKKRVNGLQKLGEGGAEKRPSRMAKKKTKDQFKIIPFISHLTSKTRSLQVGAGEGSIKKRSAGEEQRDG